MSENFSVRISKELKQKIEACPADWNQEVSAFLTERIRQIEQKHISLSATLDEVEAHAQKRTTKTDSITLIREDREQQN